MKHISHNLKIALSLALLLVVLHLLGLFFYLAWIYWWYDVLLHLVGGLVGGFSAYWCLFESGLWPRGERLPVSVRVFIVFLCVLVAAGLWEVFEYINQIAEDPRQSHMVDTTYDLVLGSLGAIFAGLKSSNNTNRLNG